MNADEHFMSLALREAQKAAKKGEVPVGALVVEADGKILSRGHNLRETTGDPTAHAEILALRKAARKLSAVSYQPSAVTERGPRLKAESSKLKADGSGRWRLTGCTVYVSMEPCPMCAGALVNARVSRLVYGCADPKAGACGTLFDVPRDRRLNHRVEVEAGIMGDECSAMLKTFFRQQREARRADRRTGSKS